MATIALGIVGNVIAPGAGGFIGAAIGGIIDSQFLLPAVFPTDSLQGPRLNDLQLTTASEGSPVKWVIGPRNRVGGTVIWQTDLKEVKETESVGGKGGGGQDVTNYKYFVSLAVAFCDTKTLPDGKIKKIKKIWADSKVIYDAAGPTNKYASIALYLGDQTTPNSLMEAHEGAGNVPHHKGTAFIVIEDLALEEFGNRVPNITAQIEQASDVSVGEAIELILTRAGYQVDEFDVDMLPQCFYGMIASGPQTVQSLLNPILLAYGIACQDRNGVLTFFSRGSEYVVSVDPADLAAHEFGDDSPRVIQVGDKISADMPYQCAVNFISTDNDLQAGSQVYTRRNFTTQTSLTISLPLTLTPELANAIAKRIIWTAEAERQPIQVSLPPEYITLLEGDRLEFTYNSVFYRVYGASVTKGNNHRIVVDGTRMLPSAYSYTGVVDASSHGPIGAYRPPETVGVVMDCASLHPDLLDSVGVYFAVCAEDPDALWGGCALYTSIDGITYSLQQLQPTEATIGYCVNTLEPGPYFITDTQNSLIVQLYNGTLASCTRDEMLAGANRALVETADGDWEVIAFQTATLIGTNRYKLSNFLRGRRGTEHLVGSHLPNARFVLLSLASINFASRPTSVLNTLEFYKTPGSQGDLDDYEEYEITLQGRSAKPLSPCNVKMEWNTTSNDYTFTWTRRTKSFMRLFGPAGAPFTPDESPEGYIIEVLRSQGPLSAVMRTATVTSPSWVYTSAMQTADGRTAGSIVTIKLYQRSNTVGRGVPFYGIFDPNN